MTLSWLMSHVRLQKEKKKKVLLIDINKYNNNTTNFDLKIWDRLWILNKLNWIDHINSFTLFFSIWSHTLSYFLINILFFITSTNVSFGLNSSLRTCGLKLMDSQKFVPLVLPQILKFAVSKLKTSSFKLRVKSQPNNLVPKIKTK